MMMKLGAAVLLGGLMAAFPLTAQAQSGHQHGTHQHGAQHGQQAGAAEREHCEKHAAKHGDESHASGSHAGHGGHGGMMAQHRTAPKMLLKHRDMLQLTAAQVEQLEAMQAAHKADCERRKAAVKAGEAAAAAALTGATPDIAAYEAGLRSAANLKVDCKVDMARLSQAGNALLTAEQRTHLGHMGHHQHGGHSH